MGVVSDCPVGHSLMFPLVHDLRRSRAVAYYNSYYGYRSSILFLQNKVESPIPSRLARETSRNKLAIARVYASSQSHPVQYP